MIYIFGGYIIKQIQILFVIFYWVDFSKFELFLFIYSNISMSFLFFVFKTFDTLFFLFSFLCNYSCAHFPPLFLPPYPHLPHSILPPIVLVHGFFIPVPWWSFPLFALLFPSHLVTVNLFFISMSLFFFFSHLFVLLIRFHL